jgi:dephospho-CoA kinase
MTLEIGITGGIGSGKSTVARIFASLGYRVYLADDRAKALYDENDALKAAIIALMGNEVYDDAGKLRRQAMAARIFSDSGLLKQVNAIVHPMVAIDFEEWRAKTPSDYKKSLVFKEAAILFEAGSNTQLDGVIMVYAPKQLRLSRVGARDHVEAQAVLARMAAQWPDSAKIDRSDFVIYNDGFHALVPQVLQAIQRFDHQ